MKKTVYEKPSIEVTGIDTECILAASGEAETTIDRGYDDSDNMPGKDSDGKYWGE